MLIAQLILLLHVVIITFNVAGLVIIPLGAWAGWRIVRIAWLRLLHLLLLAIVAGQALAGRACILTIWQNEYSGDRNKSHIAHHALGRWARSTGTCRSGPSPCCTAWCFYMCCY